jgi:uncharacterized repeat protein (TIGR01451 family)
VPALEPVSAEVVTDDLSLTKDAPTDATANSEFRYIIAVGNNRVPKEIDAVDVTVTDTLPQGVVIVTLDAGCEESGDNVVVCEGTAPASYTTLSIRTVRATETGTLINRAKISKIGRAHV